MYATGALSELSQLIGWKNLECGDRSLTADPVLCLLYTKHTYKLQYCNISTAKTQRGKQSVKRPTDVQIYSHRTFEGARRETM